MFAGFFVWMTLLSSVSGQQKHQSQLFNVLTDPKNYVKAVRPVMKTTDAVNVSFSVTLVKLNSLDEKDQTLTTTVWIRHMWEDVNLKWKPEDYGGVESIRLPINKIWTPDIVLFNGDVKNSFEPLAVVDYNGNVLLIPYSSLTSFCTVDLAKFPYDKQMCELKFGSWAYDGYKVSIELNNKFKAFDTRYFMEHHGWDLYNYEVEKMDMFYPCCKEPYPIITIRLHLQRTGSYFPYFFVAPAVLLCLLIPVMFLIPTCSKEKTTIGIGILISKVVLLTVLAEFLPSDSQTVPLVGQYYLANIVLTVLALFLVAFVINISNHGNKQGQPPAWTRKFLMTKVGRFLCVAPPKDCVQEDDCGAVAKKTDAEGQDGENIQLQDGAKASSPATAGSGCKDRGSEWHRLALVIDRILFLVFLALCILLTIGLLG